MIKKESLCQLSMAYSINMLSYHGKKYCIAASESRDGQILLIGTYTLEIKQVTGLSGGVMSIIPIPEKEGSFLAIQKFYPIFDSIEAEIVYCKLSGSDNQTVTANVTTIDRLPYVHRIALSGSPSARRLIASTLCGGKHGIEDWSQPGSIYEYYLNSDMDMIKKRCLLTGIHKNHGMFEDDSFGTGRILVAGEEGVWTIEPGLTPRQIICGPVSDLCMFDIDQDGTDELLCITPFHGNSWNIYKKNADNWNVISSLPAAFGHVIWAGLCGSTPIILLCNRGSARDTVAYRPTWDGRQLQLNQILIDTNTGAANIFVEHEKNGIVIYAANHGCNEVARYFIQ